MVARDNSPVYRVLFVTLVVVTACFISGFCGISYGFMKEATADDGLELMDVRVREAPPAARVAAGFLTIVNHGTAADRLLGGRSSWGGRIDVHEMSVIDGVMRMRPLTDGLVIAPGERVVLKPGGFHLMFASAGRSLRAGDRIDATLNFARSGSLRVVFPVESASFANRTESDHRHTDK